MRARQLESHPRESTTLRHRVPAAINELMGSAHAFASVMNEAVEEHLLEEVGGARLTFPQLSLLLLLAQKQTWRISDVATFLRVSKAAASQFVDRLVRHRFLQRHEGTTDRRIAQVSLTERSRRLVAAYEAVKNRRLAQILGAFSAAELEKAAAVLDRFSAAFLKNSVNGGLLCLRCGIYARSQCRLQAFVGPNCFYQLRASSPVRGSLRSPQKHPGQAPRAGKRIPRTERPEARG